MEKKKNIVIIILSFIIVVLSSFILYDKFLSNKNNDDTDKNDVIQDNNKNNSNENTIVGNRINEVEIKNKEVKELYNYIQSNLCEYCHPCNGSFYLNPFKNYNLNDKIGLIIRNYGFKYQKEIDDNFLNKIDKNDREFVKANSEHYIDSDVVKKGMKLLFNIDIDNFDENTTYYWNYRDDVDAFVEIMGGGGSDTQIIQQIIDYNELDNEINLTVVKAEILPYEIALNNGETIYPAGIYRLANEINTLLYKNISRDDFVFTDENIDKFPQLKYVFKKNESENYYVSDIINLNYEEDFANCE